MCGVLLCPVECCRKQRAACGMERRYRKRTDSTGAIQVCQRSSLRQSNASVNFSSLAASSLKRNTQFEMLHEFCIICVNVPFVKNKIQIILFAFRNTEISRMMQNDDSCAPRQERLVQLKKGRIKARVCFLFFFPFFLSFGREHDVTTYVSSMLSP